MLALRAGSTSQRRMRHYLQLKDRCFAIPVAADGNVVHRLTGHHAAQAAHAPVEIGGDRVLRHCLRLLSNLVVRQPFLQARIGGIVDDLGAVLGRAGDDASGRGLGASPCISSPRQHLAMRADRSLSGVRIPDAFDVRRRRHEPTASGRAAPGTTGATRGDCAQPFAMPLVQSTLGARRPLVSIQASLLRPGPQRRRLIHHRSTRRPAIGTAAAGDESCRGCSGDGDGSSEGYLPDRSCRRQLG